MSEQYCEPWFEDVQGDQVRPIIESDDKTIRVEAGPGTGKTFGLVRRVQRILHPLGLGVPNQELLVVAFNRVIAKQLRQDIAECLGSDSNSELPVIQTVHAMCLQVLGWDLRILLPHEREAMVYDVINTYPQICQQFQTNPRGRLHSKVDQALRDHEAKNEEHMELWQAVREWLVRHQAELISELPNLLLDRIQGGDFQEQTFRHVIVDEFQDLTPGEQQLFLKLKKEEGAFLALGDPRQSIYAFRGNDRDGLRKLDNLVPASGSTVKDISMTECRRCPDLIVKAANQLMSLSPSERLVSGSDENANTHLVWWRSYQAEAKGMAKAIVDNIRENPHGSHLVMVTRRRFGYKLREEINALDRGFNVELNFSESLLETWPVREAFLFFCLFVDSDAPTWRAWLAYKNSIDGERHRAPNRNADAYLKFLCKCNDEITVTLVEQLANSSKQPPGRGGKNLRERAKRFSDLKSQMSWDGSNAQTLLEEIFDASYWRADRLSDPDKSLQAVLDMESVRSRAEDYCLELQSAKPDLMAVQLLKEVARRLRYQIATREPLEPTEGNSVSISTLWGAKGITADHVYVIGLCDEAIPGDKREEYPGTVHEFREEQRRLFYVSLTRAKRTLVLSRARYMQEWEADRLGMRRPKNNKLEMCQFLRDIMSFLPPVQDGEHWQGVIGS